MKVDDYFTKPAEMLDPRLRNWKQRLESPNMSATLEVFRRDNGLGQFEAEIHLQFVKDGELQPLESMAWDDELNSGLIQLSICAVNPENEAERFALGIRSAMRKLERRFGDGFLSSVLVEFLQNDLGLSGDSRISDIIAHSATVRLSRSGHSYDDCKEMIDFILRERASELTERLKYAPNIAKDILVSAIVQFLDDRFTVSFRRRLGWL